MCLYMYVNKSVNVYRLEIMAALQELLESSEVADEDAAPVKLFLPQAFYKASFQPRWVKSVGAGDEDDTYVLNHILHPFVKLNTNI